MGAWVPRKDGRWVPCPTCSLWGLIRPAPDAGHHRGRMVSIVLAYTHTHIHPREGGPVCKPHEVYLDLVCAAQGTGQETVTQFLRFAKDQLGRRAVRIYAVTALRGYWLEKFQFQQAESVLLRDGRCVLDDYGPRSYCFEEEGGWNPTWRMCKVLQPAPPRGYVPPREAIDPEGAAGVRGRPSRGRHTSDRFQSPPPHHRRPRTK